MTLPALAHLQGTTSEAVVVALLAARARALRGRPPGDALRLVVYSSDQVGRGQGFGVCWGQGTATAPKPLPHAPSER